MNNLNFQIPYQLPGMIAFVRWSFSGSTKIVQPGTDLRIISTNLSEDGILLHKGLYGFDMIRKFPVHMLGVHLTFYGRGEAGLKMLELALIGNYIDYELLNF